MKTSALAVMAVLKQASVNVALAPAEGSYWKQTLLSGLVGAGSGYAAMHSLGTATGSPRMSAAAPIAAALTGALGLAAGAHGDYESRRNAELVNDFERMPPAQQLALHNAIMGDDATIEEQNNASEHLDKVLAAHAYRNNM